MSDESDGCFVICPYCGNSYQAECEDFSEDDRIETCDECGKDFIHWDEFEITHHTKKIKETK